MMFNIFLIIEVYPSVSFRAFRGSKLKFTKMNLNPPTHKTKNNPLFPHSDPPKSSYQRRSYGHPWLSLKQNLGLT